jgi:hypothetical protein
MIKEISEFSGDVHCCFGNTDDRFLSPKLAQQNNVNLHGDIGELELDNKKIAFTHFPQVAEGLAFAGKYDIVFHGHTHTARKEKINSTLLINPGEIMGWRNPPSYAIYDTETNEVEMIKLDN